MKRLTAARPRTGIATVVALASALLLLLAAPAGAYVYWTNPAKGKKIGRANLDGTGATRGFITGPCENRRSDSCAPWAIAVDAGHLYWTGNGDKIGRANLDGSDVETGFIAGVDAADVAVDAGHVYWASHDSGAIGRANLDGSGVDKSFIGGLEAPEGVAVDAGHVYWASHESGAIGRANLDGSGVDKGFITDLLHPADIALDAGHIYWTGETALGRANLDGSGVDKSFITDLGHLHGVAVDGDHLYWSSHDGSIGRASPDGSGMVKRFMRDVGYPQGGIAVDSTYTADTSPPGTTIKRKQGRVKRKFVRFKFRSSEPNSSFECRIDARRWEPCGPGRHGRRFKAFVARKLDRGRHRFEVRAVDAAGNSDPTPAKDSFRVV